MSDLPAKIPSLAQTFEAERKDLKAVISVSDLSAPQIVSEARKALDRTGQVFASEISDPQIQKAGLWLLEMVKSGAGVLDQGTGAEIIWHEVPKVSKKTLFGQGLFFAVALGLFLLAFAEGSWLGMGSIIVLSALKFFSQDTLKNLRPRLPFMKKPIAIEDMSGRNMKAEARITAHTSGFIDALSQSLKTADHLLMQLSVPAVETHWRQDQRLMVLIQSLMEAGDAKDGNFALKLIGQELESILASEGIKRVEYSKKTKDLFDVLPALGNKTPKVAAPALMAGDNVIRRGTVWSSDNE